MDLTLLIAALVMNVAVALYLKPWAQVANYIGLKRGERQINAFRVAGLLLVLVAVGHSQTVVGVDHDGDYENMRAVAKANGIDVGKWNVQYSRGDDAIAQPHDWAHASEDNFGRLPGLTTAETYRMVMFVWNNAGKLLALAFVLFLLFQFGHGGEADETNIHEQLDPEYRTGFVTDYHGDDAFEVPDGMHSEHQAVPVRGRGASAGR